MHCRLSPSPSCWPARAPLHERALSATLDQPSPASSPYCRRYVSAFLPRAVYTSGKSSSAAGLTATVVKVGLQPGGGVALLCHKAALPHAALPHAMADGSVLCPALGFFAAAPSGVRRLAPTNQDAP